MNTTGHVGHLDVKTSAELLILLQRQEKLLENKSFIQKLPDKGKKIEMMIDNIKSILSTKQSVDQSADMFQNLSIKENTAEYDFDVGHLINPNSSQKVITDERSGFVNSYDRVIRRTDKETKLCPNRLNAINKACKKTDVKKASETSAKPKRLLDSKVDDIGSESTSNSSTKISEFPDVTNNCSGRLKYRYDDSLMAGSKAQHRFDTVKLIDIEESAALMMQQHKKLQEIQIKHAAERLADCEAKIGTSLPTSFSSSSKYRCDDPVVEQDSDDDDDDNDDEKEIDYPC